MHAFALALALVSTQPAAPAGSPAPVPEAAPPSPVSVTATASKTEISVGEAFTLDDMGMSIGFNQPIGAGDYGFEVIELTPGAHHIESAKPFGITVSGVAAFTSYLFAGGLNLLELAPQ